MTNCSKYGNIRYIIKYTTTIYSGGIKNLKCKKKVLKNKYFNIKTRKNTKKRRLNMVKEVIKRDGTSVPFNGEKIINAIRKAFLDTNELNHEQSQEVAEIILNNIEWELENQDIAPFVETLQDMVVDGLIEEGYRDTAISYAVYRAEHTKTREQQRTRELDKKFSDIIGHGSNSSVNKNDGNANVSSDSPFGKMLMFGAESSKAYAINHLLRPDIAKAHGDGDIHIHDLDCLTLQTLTCVQLDLGKLFKDGFNTGHGYIREPQSIMSYAALAAVAIQANQNQMHGGQSVPALDYMLAPGVRKSFNKNLIHELSSAFDYELGVKDAVEKGFKESHWLEENEMPLTNNIDDIPAMKILTEVCNYSQTIAYTANVDPASAEELSDLIVKAYVRAYEDTDKQTYQAMESFIHNLNTLHSRAGSQVPFSSVNYGTDTSAEGRMVMKNLLLSTEAGLGNGETPIFPIQIFKLKEGVSYNPEDPNYDLFELACKVTAKRLFPNFSFLDAPFNLQFYKEGHPETEATYMGCRTRVLSNIAGEAQVYNRGNLSFTSINLPRLAIKAKLACPDNEGERIKKFFELLDEKMVLVKEQLLERMAFQGTATKKNFDFLFGQGVWQDSDKLGRDEPCAEILRHGSLTIGFIGLAETLKALIGKHHGESEDAQELGLRIVGHMRELTDKWTEEYRLNFGIIGTPAESLSGRFVRIDKEKYGEIEGVTDKEWYTNSNHIPVEYPISIYDKIRLEAPYHELENAGHISYIELDGDTAKNPEAIMAVVRAEHDAGCGYAAINHPVDHDPVCGYTGVIDNECPGCGRTEEDGVPFERIRRITGYLVGTVDVWVTSKQAEEKHRVKHSKYTNFDDLK